MFTLVLNELKQELSVLKDTLNKENRLLIDQQKYVDEWVHLISRNDIKECAMEVVINPAFDYYTFHFNDSSGDLYKFQKSLDACKVLFSSF